MRRCFLRSPSRSAVNAICLCVCLCASLLPAGAARANDPGAAASRARAQQPSAVDRSGLNCDPRDDGAAGDGNSIDTAALQAALDGCAGGQVLVSAGTYLTGPLFLSSGTTLELAAGAMLLGVDDPAAYRRPSGGLFALLNATDADNLTLMGLGTIDGNGLDWWEAAREPSGAVQPADQRPRLIELDRCQHIRISGLTLQDSPSFHLVLRSCSDVDVAGITVLAPPDAPNTDGVDLLSSRDVRIAGSTIDNGDDDVAIKSGSDDPAHPGAASADIMVTGCTFLHGHGVSIGSETIGGVSGVTVADSSFQGTRNGVRIKTNRDAGGPITNILYENLTMSGVEDPIAFASYYPTIPPTNDAARPISAQTPSVSDLQIVGLTAEGAAHAGYIVGLPEVPYASIALANVSIGAGTGLVVRNASVSASNTTVQSSSGPAYVLQDGGMVAINDPADQPNQ